MHFLVGAASCTALVIGGWFVWRYHGPAAPTEIYRGITYGCERAPDTAESGGLVHWVCADLNVPGVSLYVTPLDPDAVSHGSEYKLKYTSTAVAEQQLAAGVNATLFASDSWLIRLPGDLASSNETVVADHVVTHVHAHSYMLWWGDDLMAHVETTKPPSVVAIRKAKWAVSGQQVVLFNGSVVTGPGLTDKRTMVAADPEGRRVWAACFDQASYRYAAFFLAEKGAKIGVMLDGGTSVAMAVGESAKNVRAGTVTGNWRPVATHFGFLGTPLP